VRDKKEIRRRKQKLMLMAHRDQMAALIFRHESKSNILIFWGCQKRNAVIEGHCIKDTFSVLQAIYSYCEKLIF